MQKRFNTLLAPENRGGNLRPVSGASVTVTDPNGALATIYSDNGVTAAANPLTSSATGYYEYYAADGRYTETIVKAGRDTVTISDILLEDPADSPSPTTADIASTADNKGAGLVGFLYSAVYAAGTIGKWLQDLATSAGAGLIGFIQSGTGAVTRTVQDKLRGTIINSGDYTDLTAALASSATQAVIDDATGDLHLRAGLIQAEGAKTVWGATALPSGVIRHQWFAQNSVGDWFEALAVDDNGVADGNVVVVIPKFLSMGRTGTAGFIEFGPDLGAEAIITGSGAPNFHLIQRVSRQANSGHKIGVHSTGGHWELARSSDNFAANSEVLVEFNADGVHEFRKHAGANPTLRFIGTDGVTNESDIWHDGNLRIRASVGGIVIENDTQVYFGPNATTNPSFMLDNAAASAATGLKLTARAAGAGVDLAAISSGANESLRISALGTGFVDLMTDGAVAMRFNRAASAVNSLAANPSATGSAVSLAARGNDADIDLAVTPKGTGLLKYGTFNASGDVAINGYITIKDSGGTVRKLATVA